MARFNNAVQKKSTPNTVNLAGGKAFTQPDKLALVSILLTSMLKDQYYEKGDTAKDRLVELIGKVDPLFAAKAAVFARNEFGLRSISHVAAGEIVNRVKGETWTKDFVNAVVRRADDMTEILAYYLGKYGKPVPNSLKKGLARAIGRFDAYQLAKYKGGGKAISMVDVVNLVHPNPTERNKQALQQLINGTLVSTETWEAKLSEAGKSENKADAKAEAWQELLSSGKIGYFALLRNLRNISTQAPALIPRAAELLTNEVAIRKSLIMPFRFTTAYSEVSALDRRLAVALSKAIDISCANVPALPNSLVVIDYSSSMGEGVDSAKGKGTLLGAILAKASNADVMIFGNTAAYLPYNPLDSTMTMFEQFMRHNQGGWGWSSRRQTSKSQGGLIEVGHGTDFNAIFEKAQSAYDRIFIFSDMQGWRHGGAPTVAFNAYKKRTKCEPYIYSMDLTGHGTMMFPADKVAAIPGFSEKIFDLIKVMEQDKQALLKKIESVTF